MYNQNYDYISHHGVLGMKWGVRRYQNKDGSLTSTGKKYQAMKNAKREIKKSTDKVEKTNLYKQAKKEYKESVNSEKIVGNLSVKDAKKIGARFITGIALGTIGDVISAQTGQNITSTLGQTANKFISAYNGYTIANKAIIPVVLNKENNNQKKKSSNRVSLNKIARQNMQDQQARQFMDRGRQFMDQQVQFNNQVATNQIMRFY